MPKKVKLEDIVGIHTGYMARSRIEPAANGTHCLIQMRNFDDDRTSLDRDGLTRFNPGGDRRLTVIEEKDVLFLAKGARHFAFYPGRLKMPTLAANYFYILRPGETVLPEYLCWFLNHPAQQATFEKIGGSGVRMPMVRRRELADLEVALPPIVEQESIVELHGMAEQEAVLLDELRQARRRLIDHVTLTMANGNQ